MRMRPEIDQATLVILGHFNPAIFQPGWFAANGIIGQEEARAAEIEIIHPEVSRFQTDNCRIEVERHRFVAESREGPIELVKDLVLKTFGEFLEHSPAGALGINRIVHFDAGDPEVRVTIGRALAPWRPWGEWASSFEGRDPATQGGMLVLAMRQNYAVEGYKGHVRAEVQPSIMIPNQSGIYMHINHHYDFSDRDGGGGCSVVVAALEDRWTDAMSHAEFIIDQIMKLVEETRNDLSSRNG